MMANDIKTLILLILLLLSTDAIAAPADIKRVADVQYGQDTDQTLDVYMPTRAKNAPVIFMIHGGAWSGGDKASKAEFENKVAHWVKRGFIFISTNYRTLPKIRPIEQAKDIEAALLFAQRNISQWGGAADKFILMGHSSGAHLVSLLSSQYTAAVANGITPWLGTISLDISGYNIVKILTASTPSAFYLEKFGDNPDYWQAASPFYALDNKIPPFLAICSLRSDTACEQATHFTQKAQRLGAYAQVLAVDLSHGEINSQLGKNSCYTSYVDDFIKTLSPSMPLMFTGQGVRMKANCASNQVAPSLASTGSAARVLD